MAKMRYFTFDPLGRQISSQTVLEFLTGHDGLSVSSFNTTEFTPWHQHVFTKDQSDFGSFPSG